MAGVVRKSPSDQLDYDFDFAKWLSEGDSVISGDAEVSPAGELSVVSTQLFGTVVKVWLAGGVSGSTYELTVYATTAFGRQKELQLHIRVAECACA